MTLNETSIANQIIERRRESMRTDRAFVASRAAEAWAKLDDNEKACVRFGMIPKHVHDEYEVELAVYVDQAGGQTTIESKDFAVALMDCAARNGGMRA